MKDKMSAAEYLEMIQNKSPSKYRNKKVTKGDLVFDSIKEYYHWLGLNQRLNAGEITELKRQVPFKLNVDNSDVAKYISDFTYMEKGVYVVEDAKSSVTRKLPVYRLKKKLMKAIHNIEIKEV